MVLWNLAASNPTLVEGAMYARRGLQEGSLLNYIPHSLTLVTPTSTSSPCTQLFLIYNTY